MILNEMGGKKKDAIIFHFVVKVKEDDIKADVNRIAGELVYHGEKELKMKLGKEEFNSIFSQMMFLLYAQYMMAALSEVGLRITISKSTKVKVDTFQFENRAVESFLNDDLLTDRERIMMDKFFEAA